MNNIETMRLALEALLEDRAWLESDAPKEAWDKNNQAITSLRQAIEQAQQAEPVALKKGECWPEDVMQMWDHYRKEIASGHIGSEPRDWFESLAEMRLVDTSPPPRQPLTDEEIQKCYETTGHYQTLRPQDRFAVFALSRAIEDKLKEKNI